MRRFAGENVKRGLLFFATLKTADMAEQVAAGIAKKMDRRCVHITEASVETTAGAFDDSDRPAVKELFNILGKGIYEVLVVRSLYDISTNEADWEGFLNHAEDMGVAVYDVSQGCYVGCDYGEC